MADGTERIVPVYRISSIALSDDCILHNVKAAVLPEGTREILGLSTLIQGAPFSLSFDPPLLKLAKCKPEEI